MPSNFWSDAFLTAVYLINRMPTKNLQSTSPWQKLFSSKPNYSTLKVFGSACYPWLRPYSQHKLAPRTKRCLFIGYSLNYKGYECLDAESRRIYFSRHVIFDESHFPFQKPAPAATLIDCVTSSFPFSTWFKPGIPSPPSILGPYHPLASKQPTCPTSSHMSQSQSPLQLAPPSEITKLPSISLSNALSQRIVMPVEQHSTVSHPPANSSFPTNIPKTYIFSPIHFNYTKCAAFLSSSRKTNTYINIHGNSNSSPISSTEWPLHGN